NPSADKKTFQSPISDNPSTHQAQNTNPSLIEEAQCGYSQAPKTEKKNCRLITASRSVSLVLLLPAHIAGKSRTMRNRAK
ncbi:hypothetical protein, partial [Salmonella sp. s58408]|uniref:hypothetical protein n=1 Tax=Salmonella sp. s58408 TaxID=3159701 RepID=UPI0039817A36